MSFFSLLTILFIALKLTNVIDWSWWLVTIPIWGGGAALFLLFVGSTVYLAFFGSEIDKAKLRAKGFIK